MLIGAPRVTPSFRYQKYPGGPRHEIWGDIHSRPDETDDRRCGNTSNAPDALANRAGAASHALRTDDPDCGPSRSSIRRAAAARPRCRSTSPRRSPRGQRTLLVDMDPQGHCALGPGRPRSADRPVDRRPHAPRHRRVHGRHRRRGLADLPQARSRPRDHGARRHRAAAGQSPRTSDRRLSQVLSPGRISTTGASSTARPRSACSRSTRCGPPTK